MARHFALPLSISEKFVRLGDFQMSGVFKEKRFILCEGEDDKNFLISLMVCPSPAAGAPPVPAPAPANMAGHIT